MKTSQLLVVNTLVFGAGIALGYLVIPADAVSASSAISGRTDAEQMATAQVFEERLRKADLKIAELEAEVSEAKHALEQVQARRQEETEQALAERAGDDESSEQEERVQRALERHERWLKRREDEKLLALDSRLNLTPKQREALEEYLQKQRELDLRMRHLQMTGQSDSPERAAIQLEMAKLTFEDYMQSILSPEQIASYQEYESETEHSRNEARAARQLSDIAQFVQMSEEQKDQAYEIFYYQAQEGSGWDATMDENGQLNIETFIDQRVKALEGVLSEDQLEVYRRRLELNKEGFERYFRRFR